MILQTVLNLPKKTRLSVIFRLSLLPFRLDKVRGYIDAF